MTRRLKVPYSLARKRIRASLSKYNVYNALTWRKNRPLTTQFRQVFFAKQESRSYHGDRLTENEFKNHFRGDLPVVSPLQAARGGAAEEDIPYALQTYVGLERRLDFAVFRSLFASSVRQAAYFILRGSVKVNGVRIKSPGYILRPGDMFSIDPRRVLYAMGRPKPSKADSLKATNRIIQKFNDYIDDCHKHPQRMWARRQKNRQRHVVFNAKHLAGRARRVERHNREVQEQMQQALAAVKPASLLEEIFRGAFAPKQSKVMGTLREVQRLTGLQFADATKEAAEAAKEEPQKQEKKPRNVAVDSDAQDVQDSDEVAKEVREEQHDQNEGAPSNEKSTQAAAAAATAPSATAPAAATGSAATPLSAADYYGAGVEAPPHRGDVKRLVKLLVDSEKEAIQAAFQAKLQKVDAGAAEPYDESWLARLPAKQPLLSEEALEDPAKVKLNLPFSTTGGKLYGLAEPEKTWFTPWSPRQFLSPFAILPHHIEVDYDTCHAVYLRDPVARPGHSEVISPFNLDMHERAYLWYVARRRKNLPSLEA